MDKMGIGIGKFLPWENGIQTTGNGIWSLRMGEKCQKSNMGMGFEHCKVEFQKQMSWEMG